MSADTYRAARAARARRLAYDRQDDFDHGPADDDFDEPEGLDEPDEDAAAAACDRYERDIDARAQ